MEQRTIGKAGCAVSAIGLGCVTFGREIDEDTAYVIMDYALEKGITFFDTAEGYGGPDVPSEKIVGDWMRSRGTRDEITLCTKVGSGGTAENIERALSQSFERLQIAKIDAYKFHTPFPGVPIGESLEAMTKAVDAGQVEVIGCSNFSTKQLQEALRVSDANGLARFQITQPPYSLARTEFEGHLDRDEAEQSFFPLCQREGVSVTSFSPLAAGFLSGKYTPNRSTIPKGSRFDHVGGHADIYFNDQNFRIVERLRAKSKKLGMPMVRLAMAWAMTNPLVSCVLVGARTTDHIDNALAAYKTELTPVIYAEMAAWN